MGFASKGIGGTGYTPPSGPAGSKGGVGGVYTASGSGGSAGGMTPVPVNGGPTSVPVNGGPIGGSGSAGSGGGMFGGSFGTTPGASTPVSYNPTPMNTVTNENPQIAGLLGDYSKLRDKLQAGNDQDATNAMQRQRDMTSGMAAEAGQNAIQRAGVGGISEGARQDVFKEGARNASGLNAALTSDARKQQLAALGGQGQLALGQAGVTQGQQQFGLAQWQAQQQAAQASAQLQAMQNQNLWQNMLSVSHLYS